MISILIPVKNAAPFLSECLMSILGQTESSWEAIFVDDHSSDASLSILQTVAKRFPQIKVYSSENQGIVPALQVAYKHSKGEMITRMDADDVMPRDKLELLKNHLNSLGPGHVATGKVRYFSKEKLGDGYIRYQNWLNDLAENNTHYQDLYKECVVPSAGFMIYRSDLDKIGAFDRPIYPEDYDLVFRFYQHGLQISAVKEVIHLWRDHSSRTSRNVAIYSGHFFDLKLPYFLALTYDSNKQLLLFGAGKKGKLLAQKLIDRQIPFHWLTNNPKKIGKDIYGKILLSEKDILLQPQAYQAIIVISAPEDVKEMNEYLSSTDMVKAVDYYWFC